MPSLKSRLVALVLQFTRKKAFATPEGLHEWIAASRRTQDHRPPIRVTEALDVRQDEIDGRPIYRVQPKDGAGRRHILYLHGGAFCFELTSYHWGLIAEMSERLNAQVTVPVYPLAPEHRYDDIFGFAMAVYRDCLANCRPHDLTVMGDSAGGNMAVILAMMGAAEGLASPGKQVLISPSLDMTMPEEEALEAVRNDPWLDIPGGLEALRLYAPDFERTDWRISPIYGDLSVLPPTLIMTGTRDLLTPGSVRFAQKARAAGADVEIAVEDGMVHVWPLIDMPETLKARDDIVSFVKRPRADNTEHVAHVPIAAAE
jgi:acetyl esterase/lipase